MKKGIIGILNNPATSLNHHSTGMVNIVKSLFHAEVLTEKGDWFFSVAGNAETPIIDKNKINSYRDWNDLKDFKN